jgi:hypothetical protein
MRIVKNYAYFYKMKARLNITIDNNLLTKAKVYADRNNTSLSQIIENYLKTFFVKAPIKEESIFEMIEDKKPTFKVDRTKDLVKEYYENKK